MASEIVGVVMASMLVEMVGVVIVEVEIVGIVMASEIAGVVMASIVIEMVGVVIVEVVIVGVVMASIVCDACRVSGSTL
jgi:hypothetical protein